MTKEEYLVKKESVDEKIKDLKEEMRSIGREYVDSQLKIPIGSKVEITSSKKSEVGIVSSKRISYSGTPFYKLKKVKKRRVSFSTRTPYMGYRSK